MVVSTALSKAMGIVIVLLLALGAIIFIGGMVSRGPQGDTSTPGASEGVRGTPAQLGTPPAQVSPKTPGVTTPRLTTTPPTTTAGGAGGGQVSQPLYEKISLERLPYFMLSVETPYIVLPQGGEASVVLRAEPFNGYSGSVRLFVHSTWISQEQLDCYARKANVSFEDIFNREGSLSRGFDTLLGFDVPNPGIGITFAGQEVPVPGEARVVISVPGEGVPECTYTIVVSGIDSEGLMHSASIVLAVVKKPSYIVRPTNSSIPALKPNSKYSVEVEVVPVGDYRKVVNLSAVAQVHSPVIADIKARVVNAVGVPPYRFTLEIETGVVRTPPGDQGSVIIALFDTNSDEDPRYRLYIEAGLAPAPEQRGGGLFSLIASLLEIVTLPFRLIAGLGVGLTTGAILTPFIPFGADISNGLKAGLQLFAPELLAERLAVESYGGASIVNGWPITWVRTGLLGDNNVSLVLPTRTIYVQCSRAVEIPFQIFYNEARVDPGNIALTLRGRFDYILVDRYFSYTINIAHMGNPAVGVLKIYNLSEAAAVASMINIELIAYPRDRGLNLSDYSMETYSKAYGVVELHIVPSCPAAEPPSALVFLIPGAKAVVPFKTAIQGLALVVDDSKTSYGGNISARVYIFEGSIEPPNRIATPIEGVIYIEADNDTPAGLIGVGEMPHDYVKILLRTPGALWGRETPLIDIKVVVGRGP